MDLPVTVPPLYQRWLHNVVLRQRLFFAQCNTTTVRCLTTERSTPGDRSVARPDAAAGLRHCCRMRPNHCPTGRHVVVASFTEKPNIIGRGVGLRR